MPTGPERRVIRSGPIKHDAGQGVASAAARRDLSAAEGLTSVVTLHIDARLPRLRQALIPSRIQVRKSST